MFVVINTEIQSRELDANLLLAIQVASHGGTALVADQAILPELLGELPYGGIFHAKSAESSIARKNQQLKLTANGYLITAQDQEHGLLRDDYEITLRERFSLDALSRVTRYFAWGPADFSALGAAFPTISNRILQVGSPRLDLLKPEFFDEPSPPTVKGMKNHILFISSTESHSRSRYWEILENMEKLGESIRAPEIVEERFNYWADEIRAIPSIISALKAVSEAFSEVDIIVRPHFSEDPDAWNSLTKGLERISVKTTGSVAEAMRNSLAVLHYGSTVALEAIVAGVPAITIPGRIGRNSLTGFSNSLSVEPADTHELLEYVSNLASGTSAVSEDQLTQLRSRFRVDDGLASERIVREWLDLARAKDWGALSRKQIHRVRSGVTRGARRVEKNMTGAPTSGLAASGRAKFPPLDPAHVSRRLTEIAGSVSAADPRHEIIASRAILISPR